MIDTHRPQLVVLEDVIAAAGARGYPAMYSHAIRRTMTGRDGWQRLRQVALVETDLAALARELDALDNADVAAAARAREADERRPLDADAPPTLQELVTADMLEADAARAAFRRSAEGQAEAMITLLERIAAAVEVKR